MAAEQTLLIVDDDEVVRDLLIMNAESRGWKCLKSENGEEAIKTLKETISDVVLLDVQMPVMDGITCLLEIHQLYPHLPVIMLSGADEIDMAVKAMKAGAVDFIAKPFDMEALFESLRQNIEVGKMKEEYHELKQAVGVSRPRTGIIGSSPLTQELIAQVRKLAQTKRSVLLRGESGVGKSFIARSIHYEQTHNGAAVEDKPFIPLSCPAIPSDLLEAELFGHEKGAFTGASASRIGSFEMAKGGTLFLDEVGDLPVQLQPKLLNVLQDKKFSRLGSSKMIETDARIIAATNRDLEQMVEENSFRKDLFFRLSVVPLDIPSLRARAADIPELTCSILERIAEREDEELMEVSDSAMELLCQYPWPGNIRELENVLNRSSMNAVNGKIIPESLNDEVQNGANSVALPVDPGSSSSSVDSEVVAGSSKQNVLAESANPVGAQFFNQLGGMNLKEIEKIALQETLKQTGGNKAKAARSLGITEKSVYNKLDKYKLR